jgi:OmcA/MtrC family decaheme c-type cytochrome
VTKAGDVLTVEFSSTNPAVVPTLTVSMYGWDTKDFLISCHTRDANSLRMEFKTTDANNAIFTNVPTGVPGKWKVTVDLSKYVPAASTGLPSIPTLITEGKVKKAEIVVLPSLTVNGQVVALNAPSKTFDLVGNAFVANYFQGEKALVTAENCNTCHDQLGTTFHNGSYGGNVVVCRTCHVVTNGGSHLEMQSRSIDSYVHAVHEFQAFDIGEIDFTDPVEAKRYGLHVEHTYPNFTIKNCQSCHESGKFDVPDQSKAMPGLFSASAELTGKDRAIAGVPSYVAGAGSRACAGCHRAEMINVDAAGELASLNAHTEQNGVLVENEEDYLYQVINKIMGYFD